MVSELEPDIEQVTVADDGDVVLLVGSPSYPSRQKAIRVASAKLSFISPVFKVLFGPHFNEGQQPRSSRDPVKIKLPDDQAQPVLNLCRLAHHRCDGLSEGLLQGHQSVNAIHFEDLAVVLDKYDCVEPFKLQCTALLLSWLARDRDSPDLERPKGSSDVDHLLRIAGASLILRSPQAFKIVTSRIILRTNANLVLPNSSPRPPLNFLSKSPARQVHRTDQHCRCPVDALEAARSVTWRRFYNTLPELGIPKCESLDCDNDNRDAKFMQELANAFDLQFWPPNPEKCGSLQHLLSKTRSIVILRREKRTCAHSGSNAYVDKVAFNHFADEMEKSCRGLCLSCLVASTTDPQTECFRHAFEL